MTRSELMSIEYSTRLVTTCNISNFNDKSLWTKNWNDNPQVLLRRRLDTVARCVNASVDYFTIWPIAKCTNPPWKCWQGVVRNLCLMCLIHADVETRKGWVTSFKALTVKIKAAHAVKIYRQVRFTQIMVRLIVFANGRALLYQRQLATNYK